MYIPLFEVLQLEGLKVESLLKDIGDGIYSISMHDLYFEFVEMEAKRSALYVGQCALDVEKKYVRCQTLGVEWQKSYSYRPLEVTI